MLRGETHYLHVPKCYRFFFVMHSIHVWVSQSWSPAYQHCLQANDAIRDAILRYDIHHPCVNDANMELWRALGVSAWPTLALVSPSGRLLTMLSGLCAHSSLADYKLIVAKAKVCMTGCLHRLAMRFNVTSLQQPTTSRLTQVS